MRKVQGSNTAASTHGPGTASAGRVGWKQLLKDEIVLPCADINSEWLELVLQVTVVHSSVIYL